MRIRKRYGPTEYWTPVNEAPSVVVLQLEVGAGPFDDRTKAVEVPPLVGAVNVVVAAAERVVGQRGNIVWYERVSAVTAVV